MKIPAEWIGPRRAHFVATLAGRDRERPVQDRYTALPLVDRALREVQRDARPIGAALGRAVVVVHLQHDLRAFREQHADAGGHDARLGARSPAAEAAGRCESRPAETRVAGTGIGAIEVLRRGRRIDVREDVMHELPIARRVLDFRDPAILGEIRRDHETAIDVAGARRHRVHLGHFENVIGRSQLPSFREHQRWRKLREISLRRARLDPPHQRRELEVGESARIDEVAEPGHGLPWRHDAPLDGVSDVVQALVHIAIGEQRKRRVLSGAVTRLAAC
ncbi:MAG: hypothetical protein DMD95_14930, partial [Candidatus Rokuibacteriota bacterium]